MAPRSRRGGGKASSAAAAAAARRPWKVGDLVLAKVKGFPAWPATVSEPEKWGYSTDWKKVFVYFFGTKQIAFCNPADVEAFTEEKRKSLLVKRHGKGADFLRALEEIIDCFEKSKKHDGGEGVEGTVSNAGTCEGSAAKSSEKFETKSPIPDPLFGRLCASVDRNGSNFPIDVPAAAFEIAVSHDLETVFEDPIENTLVPDHPKETKLATSNSRKRSREKPVQNCSVQKKAPSVRRSRSSKKVDSSKFENLIMAVNDLSKKNGVVPNVIQGEPIRRNRRIRETFDSAVWHDMVSPVYSAAYVSNGSSEDNASEIVATNSDAVSMNEASTLDSTCETEHPDIVVDYLEKDVQVSETLLVCAKTVVKKKRKPNRKRVAHCPAGVATSPKKEFGEIGGDKAIPSSPTAIEKLSEGYCKADGDKHLPLVKRARVRMGKLSTEEKETNNLLDTEEKSSKEISMNHSEPVSVSSGCPNNYLTCRASLVEVKEAGNGPSVPTASAQFSENEPLFWKAKKFQLRGCSADGEAALPPSKRLHRALEAMSANAAEDDQINTENQRTTITVTSNGCSSSHEKSSHTTMENDAGNELEVQDEKHSCDDLRNMGGRSGLVPSLSSPSCETPEVTSSEAKSGECIIGTSISPKLGDCKVSIPEAQNSLHTRDLDDSSLNTRSGETEVWLQSSQPSSSFGEKHDSLESPPGLIPSASFIKEEDKIDLLGPSNQSSVDISKGGDMNTLADKSDGENGAKSSDFVSEAKDIQCASPSDDVTNSNSCEDTKYTESPPNENIKVEGMCEVVKEVQVELAEKDIDAPSYDSSMKGLIAAAQAKRHLSHATSLSENSMEDKIVSDTMQSPSITRTTDYSQKVSPRHFSVCLRSTSVNSNYLLHNGSGSPDVPSNYKKTTHVLEMDKGHLEPTVPHRQKLLSKWTSAEVNAARKSFEVLLGTLSRTKDSIGRATRLAIDCAKYGIAGEVVEILARSLESESSLHRRVDLFFLVDSIIQCSRGQKGAVGDIYTSAVQAALPRLLSAAAPPGSAARENRRQCLKVLKLWLERKALRESIIRHHMQEIDDAFFIGSSSRRPSRTERSLNDPVREMEGMLVDEYGSNANFQLPGFFMPRMREDGGSDTDEKSFEAVTPEQEPEIPVEREATPTSATAKHRHILEDVDGELEMEDVAPSCLADVNSSYNVAGVGSLQKSDSQFKQRPPLPLAAPPLPEDKPPSPPPLPTSPQPTPSLHSLPLPPPPPPLPLPHSFVDSADSNHYTNISCMSNGLQQTRHMQSGAPSVNSMTSDTGHYYAPGYRDFAPQMQRPGFSSSSDPSCSFPGLHTSTITGNNVQQMDGAPLHNYHLQPPPPILSNQFSYIQPDQSARTWNEASSSSFTKRLQFGHDVHRENTYDNQDSLGLGQHEIGDRCRVPPPVHLGPVHSDNIDSSYTPLPYYGPPAETVPNREWSYPPVAFNYQHGTPLRPPEISGANGGPNFWRPR